MDLELIIIIVTSILIFIIIAALILWSISSNKSKEQPRPKAVKKIKNQDKNKTKKNIILAGYSEKGQAIFLLIILILFALGYLAFTIIICFIQGKRYYLGGFLFLLMALEFAPYKKEVKRAFNRIYEAGKPMEHEDPKELKEQIKKELLEELKQEEQQED